MRACTEVILGKSSDDPTAPLVIIFFKSNDRVNLMNKLQFYRDQNIDFYEIKEGQNNLPAERAHCHAQFAIGVIENGTSAVSCQKRNFLVDSQHIVFFPPKVMHHCNPQNISVWKFKMLYIEKSWMETVFGSNIPSAVIIKRLSAMDVDTVKKIFLFLKSPADVSAKKCTLILLLNLIFTLANTAIYENTIPMSKVATELKNYLENNYWQNVSLAEMTALINKTNFQLIRLFNRSYGLSPHAYLTQLRIARAKEMLKAGLTINNVALSLGFYDQSHFARAFKQYVGVTPLMYQQVN